jgi:hypothetical protein
MAFSREKLEAPELADVAVRRSVVHNQRKKLRAQYGGGRPRGVWARVYEKNFF